MELSKYKRILNWTWLLLICLGLTLYLVFPDRFTASEIKRLIGENEGAILITYILLSSLRAILFLPSTLFVLMGIMLYPDQPALVFVISMFGILVGSSLVYKAAWYLKPEALFKGKNLTRMEGVRRKMEKHGFGIVLLWSFFPAVPTDLICYVAGLVNMKYLKFLIAMTIGEAILVSIYVWTGLSLLEYLF